MRRSLPDREFHALYCPVKNAKAALFLVASFSVTAFVSWRGLHTALEQPSYVELLVVIPVVIMLAKWLEVFTCLRERLILSLVIVSIVTGEVTRFVPSVFGKHSEMIKFGKLALSLLGVLVSLTMFMQSARSPAAEPNES
jgi:hypothetical protein